MWICKYRCPKFFLFVFICNLLCFYVFKINYKLKIKTIAQEIKNTLKT